MTLEVTVNLILKNKQQYEAWQEICEYIEDSPWTGMLDQLELVKKCVKYKFNKPNGK